MLRDIFQPRRVAAAATFVLVPGWSTLALTPVSNDVSGLRTLLDQLNARLAQLESAPVRSPAEPGRLRLIAVSMDGLLAVGSSSVDNDTLPGLQGGGHNPQRRGFTLQQAEVSLAGVVDPYLTGEAHVVFLEDGVELEEAFIPTTSLPGGLQLKAGHFLAEFGRMNPTHPHAWRWIDEPVINSRLLGLDGTRAPGARLAWQPSEFSRLCLQ